MSSCVANQTNGNRHAPAITGMGAFCSLGRTIGELAESVMAGRDGIGLIRRFSATEFGDRYAALITEKQEDELARRYPGLERRIAMAVASGTEAWDDAKLSRYPSDRIALVFGICVGKYGSDLADHDNDGEATYGPRLQDEVHAIANHLSIHGPAIAVSTACASSAHAIGLAHGILDHGFADAVMVGGTGDMPIEMFAGFHALGAMGPAPCAPYSLPPGLNLGEGAGFLVLERDARQSSRTHGYLLGYGSSLDAHDATTPDPYGAGVARAITRALRDSGVAAEMIGYVNSHGTGTAENDKSEWLGIRTALGDHAPRIPVSSSKSFIGHTGAAAGVLEAIITLLSMSRGVVPPTLHSSRPRRLAPADPVFSPAPRAAAYSRAISCNSAFGGANAAVVFGLSGPRHRRPLNRRRLYIRGVGCISAAGPGRLMEALAAGRTPSLGGRARDEELAAIDDTSDSRTLDPVARFCIAASVLALRDAGMRIDERLGAGVGIVGGVSRVPAASLLEFRDSVKQRGLAGLSSRAFSRLVMNAALGATAKRLGVHGPCSNIAAGDGAGLLAVITAAMIMNGDEEAPAMLAVAADESYGPDVNDAGLAGAGDRIEGAGGVVIGPAEDEGARHLPRIDGIGLSGPGCPEAAVRCALGKRDPARVDAVLCGLDDTAETRRLFDRAVTAVWGGAAPVINCTPALGYAEASSSMFAFILGALALTGGLADPVRRACGCGSKPLRTIMVVSVSPINASGAVVLTNE